MEKSYKKLFTKEEVRTPSGIATDSFVINRIIGEKTKEGIQLLKDFPHKAMAAILAVSLAIFVFYHRLK